MSQQLTNIAAVIDMDGFLSTKVFSEKNWVFMSVGDATAHSFFFDTGLQWNDLMPKDQRACRYVQKYIHKLPFGVPVGVDALPLSSLPKIISQLYGNVRQNSRSNIAYKGGIYERDLLPRLNIPALDLQDYGCPKAEKLFDQLVWLETCGKHTENAAYQHCAKVEVEAFVIWLEKTLDA
jgi:hypothetical protein